LDSKLKNSAEEWSFSVRRREDYKYHPCTSAAFYTHEPTTFAAEPSFVD
jgi:hypothetical protein